MVNDTFTVIFDCEFMRDGNTCYEVITIQLPKAYENEEQGKGSAIAIESALESIKTQKSYDSLIKMKLREWSPDSDNGEE
jgi:hypothetical protein